MSEMDDSIIGLGKLGQLQPSPYLQLRIIHDAMKRTGSTAA